MVGLNTKVTKVDEGQEDEIRFVTFVAFVLVLSRAYSYLNATFGSMRAARWAGR
jgi:hypothetical protein